VAEPGWPACWPVRLRRQLEAVAREAGEPLLDQRGRAVRLAGGAVQAQHQVVAGAGGGDVEQAAARNTRDEQRGPPKSAQW
jgi:hypothetical protein